MKKKFGFLMILCLLVVVLMMPAARLNVHSSVDPATAALFPAHLTLLDILLKGSNALPVNQISAMGLAQLGQGMLIVGCALMILAAVTLFIRKRCMPQLSMLLSGISCVFFFSFATTLSNTSSTLLFGHLIDMQFWCYIPAALALIFCGAVFFSLRSRLKAEGKDSSSGLTLPLTDRGWRKLSAVLALAAVLCMLLPYIQVSVPSTITESVSSKTLNRSVSLIQNALDNEALLNTDVTAAGEGTDVLTGDLGVLNPYSNQSASNNNIKYIFLNNKANTAPNAMLLASAGLLLLGILFALLSKTDRWFSVCFLALGAMTAVVSAFSLISVGDADFYSKAGRQLVYLGLGRVTPVPLVMMLLSCCAFLAGAMGIRRANEPYFVNPLPPKARIRVVALALAACALFTLFMPSASFTFYKAGGSNTVSATEISGIQALTFSAPDDLLHPKDKKGKIMYTETPAKEGLLSAGAVESAMSGIATGNSVCTWATLVLTLAGILMLLTNRPQKLIISCFGVGFLCRGLQWLLTTLQMSSTIGEASGTMYLYLSMPLLLFAAFFSAFVHLEQIPKKYRLFLMMLPFLVSVFLFSYLPLAGWRYAFYNYKFGKPWSQQEFVGLKWFTEMFTNAGHFTNIVRVMKNTLGMSLLGLAFSWLPMFFAIFLNEINNVRFRKFVQIFTTLPNFISWALVFSFAMVMFAMETGIFSKFMLAIGAINQPVAWLNSGEHIWLKMWAWGTWKGLGWSSIMYLAAIAGIDQEMYEAARVDGANRWNVIRHITIPSLLPTFFVLLLLSISNIINNGMEQYLVFQNPMNKSTIEVLDLYVYNITIASKGTTMYSFGTAIGILKTIVSVTLLFTANFVSKRLRGESIL